MGNPSLFSDTFQWLQGLNRDLMNRRSLIYLLVLAGTTVLTFGLAFYMVDPNVGSFWDGVWYAWVTMTHVGYGDVVVNSFFGRLLASLLILCGIVLLALCTATISAALIGRDTDQIGREIRLLGKETGRIEADENHVLVELARIQEKLVQIEERLKKQELS